MLFDKDGIKEMTPNEKNKDAPKHWNTEHFLFSLLGKELIKFDKKVFTTLYVKDESSAGFELLPAKFA